MTYYVYDGNVVIEEQDSNNDETARNVYGRNLITRETSDGVVVYAYNGHSDVVAICNLDGDTLVIYDYDEFGNVISETVIDETYTNFDNPYRYAGYEYIEEVKLYDLNARYYNPEIARFLSADPYYNLGNRVIGLYEINVPTAASIMQANNLYVYCGNSPITLYDKSGYSVSGVGGTLYGAFGLRLEIQVYYVSDDNGNEGIIVVGGIGGGTPNAGVSGTGFYNADADTIFDLEGMSVSVGGSVGYVGGDLSGDLSGGAVSGGPSVLPAELHGTVTFGKVIWSW